MPAPFDLLPRLLDGLFLTVQIAGLATVLALVAALGLGLARVAPTRAVRWPALAVVETLRGTSALVQLFWAYFALPFLGVDISAFTAGWVVLGLNTGAYGAEVVRGALLAVPRGQRDAAIALGFSPLDRLTRITLPQALIEMLPAWGNLQIELIKNTALVSMVTLADLTFRAQTLIAVELGRRVEILVLVLVLYLCLAQVVAFAIRRADRFLATRLGRQAAAS